MTSTRHALQLLIAVILGMLAALSIITYIVVSYRYSDAVTVWMRWGQPATSYDDGASFVFFVAWFIATICGVVVSVLLTLHWWERKP